MALAFIESRVEPSCSVGAECVLCGFRRFVEDPECRMSRWRCWNWTAGGKWKDAFQTDQDGNPGFGDLHGAMDPGADERVRRRVAQKQNNGRFPGLHHGRTPGGARDKGAGSSVHWRRWLPQDEQTLGFRPVRASRRSCQFFGTAGTQAGGASSARVFPSNSIAMGSNVWTCEDAAKP